MKRSRTIAIAGGIAALTFAATPVAAIAATTGHAAAPATRVEHSRDIRGAGHADRTPDRSSADRSADRSIDVRGR